METNLLSFEVIDLSEIVSFFDGDDPEPATGCGFLGGKCKGESCGCGVLAGGCGSESTPTGGG